MVAYSAVWEDSSCEVGALAPSLRFSGGEGWVSAVEPFVLIQTQF